MVRVIANGPGDQSSVPSLVILMTQKMILDAFLLNTQHYKIWIKGKWSNTGIGVAPTRTPQYESYSKERLWVVHNYGRPTYLTYI